MALNYSYLASSLSCSSLPRFNIIPQNKSLVPKVPLTDHRQGLRAISCQIAKNDRNDTKFEQVARQSANYKPTIWKYEYIQSLDTDYLEQRYIDWANKLKEDVKKMLENVENELSALEMIDDLQRLGISYLFDDEIESVLRGVYNTNKDIWGKDDLYVTSLKFRLLRQHGYNVPQDVFNNFKDEAGEFEARLSEDTKGLLSLYEASFHSIENEFKLEEARGFSTKHLKGNLEKKTIMDPHITTLVTHALDFPLHWMVPRVEARWFIDVYEKEVYRNPIILELAKLDFNMVQAIHRTDLKYVSRWWKDIDLGEKLSFARDRLAENFLWTVGVRFEPQYGNLRRMAAKITTLILIIDDIYDVYGNLEELELFTNAVERWDTTLLEQLPEYMRLCYLALFNTINDFAFDMLKEDGLLIIPNLTKTWGDFCKSLLLEAKWCYNGYKPTFEEYMNNAWISSSVPVMMLHGYAYLGKPITNVDLRILEKHPSILPWSSMAFRLANDLVTSLNEMENDMPKSIQCYMSENGVDEEKAREELKNLIGEMWKKMNKEREADSPLLTRAFIDTNMNVGRMSQLIYKYHDGHTSQGSETRDLVSSLLLNPVPLN